MANPSLQIGNSNWAIKEDNLLGYSTAGTRFVPQPITMTRASAGTRVNSSGLVETVELLGSEEVTNGSFTTDSDWTKGTGWTIGVDKAIYTGTANSNLEQGSILNSGINYILNYEVISSTLSGGIVKLSGETASAQNVLSQVVGTHSLIFTANGSSPEDFKIRIVVNTSGSYEITNISVKEYTANNLARVDYDGTASSLLAEPERTNLITYSEDFSGSGWFNTGTTVSIAESITDPSGNNNSYKLIESSGTGFHFTNTYTSTLSSANTFSFYAKSSERTQVSAFFSQSGNVGAIFDLSAETATASGTGNTATIENVGNGWYRCVVSNNGSSQISNNIRIGVQNGALDSYTGDGTSGVYIWGTQTEQGSYATSYIPTDGSTVTRVQDQYSKTGISNLINSEEGTFFLDLALLSGNTNYDLQTSIVLSDGGANNRVLIYSPTTPQNRYIALIKSEGNTVIQKTIDATDITLFNKIAVTWKTNEYKIFLNGNPIYSNTTPTATPIGLNSLFFAAYNSTVNPFYGKVKQLQVFKTALTDSELEILTT